MMKTLEKTSLFWDVDRSVLDDEEHARFIIERILGRGDIEDFKWAQERYGERELQEVFKKSRTLDPKSLHFWSQYFNIDNEICTKKRLTRELDPFWRK